jgi:predicted transcriptional regulator
MPKGATMTTADQLPHLTRAELDVMKVLWQHGRLSAREVHQQVADALGWAYSTTRTTIERLVRKDLVDKQALHGIHVYSPAISRAAGLARMVRDFAEQVLEAGTAPVVSLIAQTDTLTGDEIEELRQLLDQDPDRKEQEE